MSKKCIKMMDEHISNSATNIEIFKPSICYEDFYKTKMTSDEMTKEIGLVVDKYTSSNATPEIMTQEIMDKIKKTYKNRYYKFVSLMRGNNGQ